MCTRVAAATEKVVYEVVAEPPEPLEQAQLTPVLSSSPKASLGAYPIILSYDTYICLYYLCIRFRNCLEP